MEAKRIVSAFSTEFPEPPRLTPCDRSVDGPLLGNGDMCVAIGGGPKEQRFILCKNDLWRLEHAYGRSCPVPLGHWALLLRGCANASYRVTQDLHTATTTGVFERQGASVTMRSYVAATRNLLVVELAATGREFEARASLTVSGDRGAETETSRTGGVFWGRRAFSEGVDIPSGAAAAWAMAGGPAPRPDGSFLLAPGRPLTLVLAMDSLFKREDYLEHAIKSVSDLSDGSGLSDIRRAHEAWWADYWAKSYVSIGDPVIEKQYYLSLYGTGSCSRDPGFPPPIFGWTTTDNPLWAGDYHLNYNHQAPFYGLARANRLEQADPHDAPFLDFMERARWHCGEIYGHEGGIYPVGIGPKGIETTYGNQGYIDRGPAQAENKGLFFGQRTNGAYGLVNMSARWHCTYDPDYGRKVYPFVSLIAAFWENYLSWDERGKRFVIESDSIHEGSGPDMNSCLSLALVRLTLELALDMSRELDLDADRREKWEHILGHLSGYTFQERRGRKVFRYTEKGTDWRETNTLGIQQIYPAGQIHLDGDPELLEVSKNTIDLMGRWHDFNASNSFFPAAVRVGHDPEAILRELRKYSENARPNGFQEGNPHGIENLSTVPNTVNEMLCMGHGGVLRLFPVWPRERDAAFADIRCWGAFLVSGELKEGVVRAVSILSERGRDCTVVNPWPGERVRLTRNGGKAEILDGERVTFGTVAGEAIELAPAGDGD